MEITFEKVCVACRIKKSRCEYYANKRCADQLSSYCKSCVTLKFKEWRQNKKNRKKYKASLKRASIRSRKAAHNYVSYMKSRPCFDCHERFNPWQMDFDHRPNVNKKFVLSRIEGHGMKQVLDEMAKCDVVCSNCHRNRTYLRLHPELIPSSITPVVC